MKFITYSKAVWVHKENQERTRKSRGQVICVKKEETWVGGKRGKKKKKAQYSH